MVWGADVWECRCVAETVGKGWCGVPMRLEGVSWVAVGSGVWFSLSNEGTPRGPGLGRHPEY